MDHKHKLHLTVETADGPYQHPFEETDTVAMVVTATVDHLKLRLPPNNQWIIELGDNELNQASSLQQAGILEHATLLLRARTSGGGDGSSVSRRCF